MALGATQAAVVRLLVNQSARLSAIGAGAGLIATFGALQALSSVVQLRTMTFLHAGAFGAAVLLVTGAAALAAYQPARRATLIDPAQALRSDD
jgi:ABC-type antimicrobial peptide transport system permease subunit